MSRENCAEELLALLPVIFKRFMKVFHSIEMPRQQMELLFKVSKMDEMPASFYSTFMQIPKSNITVISNKLVEEGFIVRLSDPKDRRVILFKITEKGKGYIEDYTYKVKCEMVSKLEEYSDKDVKRLEDIVTEMNEIFERSKKI